MSKTIRLSEAIRLGASMRPQAFDSNGRDGACALRAAIEALGIKPYREAHLLNYAALQDRYPALSKTVACPACAAGESVRLAMIDGDLMSLIFHLNDHHRWTRERIADLVELHETESTPEPKSAIAFWHSRSELFL